MPSSFHLENRAPVGHESTHDKQPEQLYLSAKIGISMNQNKIYTSLR